MEFTSKEFKSILTASTNGIINNLNDCHKANNNNSERQNNSSKIKRDNRKHLYHFVARVFQNGIEYIQFKTKDGIGMCPVANIDSIKSQFDSSLAEANIA